MITNYLELLTLPLFQQFARGNPPRSDNVCLLPVVAETGLRGRSPPSAINPAGASHSAAIHTGRLSTTAATTNASGPSNPGSSDAATVTVASPAPTPQAARRNPSHHSRRHASASGRPQGATKTSESAAAITIGNHIPNISVTAALPRISTDRGAPHSGAFVGCPSAPYSIMEKMIAGTNGSPAG